VTTWRPEDIGQAMLAVARSHADKVKERTVKGAKVADFNAWWRGGDDLNARLFIDVGAVHDVREGVTHNGKDFARLCGLSFVEMMEQAGPAAGGEGAQQRRDAAPRKDEAALLPEDVHKAWATLEPDGAEPWLLERGIPSPLAMVESGFALLSEEHADRLPSSVRWWAQRKLREHGPAIVAPIRSARRNLVCSLHLRFKSGERLHLLNASMADEGAPLGYGFASAAARAELVVLTEGMADTWVGEALARTTSHAVVVGAVDVAGFSKWAPYLAKHGSGRVIVIPHLDTDKQSGTLFISEHASEAVASMRRRRATLWNWPRVMDALEPDAPDIYRARDLADVARLAPWSALQRVFLKEVGE